VRFYQIALLTTLLLFSIGCSSKKEKVTSKNDLQNIYTNTTSYTTATKTVTRSNIVKLTIDNNQTIQISKNHIQTDICHNEKFIIFNIFATWYQNSLQQLKDLDKLTSNVCIISISIDNNDSNISALYKHKISHKVIFDLQNNKFVDKITKIINIDKNFKLPMNIIYKNNNYIDNYQGVMPFEMLNYIIKDQ